MTLLGRGHHTVTFSEPSRAMESHAPTEPRDAALPSKIAEAAAAGDVEAVAAWLDSPGNSINARGGRGDCTLLMGASGNGHVPLVKLLLARGASVNMQSKQGLTALMLAAGWCLPMVTSLLLQAGARIDLRDADGYTALQAAKKAATQPFSTAGDKQAAAEVARQLCQHTANGLPVAPSTAVVPSLLKDEIIEAAATGDVAAVVAWLDMGGHIDAREKECEDTLLMCASGNGQSPLVKLLLNRGASIDLQDSTGFTALMAAVYWGKPSAVPLLLQAGARTDLCDDEGHTALQLAEAAATHPALAKDVRHLAAEVARLLHQHATITPCAKAATAAAIATEADMLAPAPLPAEATVAAASGDVEAVVTWLDGPGHVDARTTCIGSTMLITACGHGHIQLVEILLGRGARVDLQSALRDTALMTAALAGYPSVASLLLKAGARTDLLDADGDTALQIADGVCSEPSLPLAQRQGAAEIARLLREEAADAKATATPVTEADHRTAAAVDVAEADVVLQRQNPMEAHELADAALQRAAEPGNLTELREGLEMPAQQASEVIRTQVERWRQQQTQKGAAADPAADPVADLVADPVVEHSAEVSKPIVRQVRAELATVVRVRAEEVGSAEMGVVETRLVQANVVEAKVVSARAGSAREVEVQVMEETSHVQHRRATRSKLRNERFKCLNRLAKDLSSPGSDASMLRPKRSRNDFKRRGWGWKWSFTFRCGSKPHKARIQLRRVRPEVQRS